MNIPLLIVEKELYIESNLEKGEVSMTPTERKNILAALTNANTFLIYTISILARSCKFVKTPSKSPFANDDINFLLEPDEL